MLNNREDGCYLCGNPNVELHHIMFGAGNRPLADKYGCTVYLCPVHHRGSAYSPHHNRGLDLRLKAEAQRDLDEREGEGFFFKIFGRNYID